MPPVCEGDTARRSRRRGKAAPFTQAEWPARGRRTNPDLDVSGGTAHDGERRTIEGTRRGAAVGNVQSAPVLRAKTSPELDAHIAHAAGDWKLRIPHDSRAEPQLMQPCSRLAEPDAAISQKPPLESARVPGLARFSLRSRAWWRPCRSVSRRGARCADECEGFCGRLAVPLVDGAAEFVDVCAIAFSIFCRVSALC